jgi:hypothetical protein
MSPKITFYLGFNVAVSLFSKFDADVSIATSRIPMDVKFIKERTRVPLLLFHKGNRLNINFKKENLVTN